MEFERQIVLRFPDATAFASGRSELQDSILPAIDRLAEILRGVEGQIVVSGHTDSLPIVTDRVRSNWDLSVMRAVSLVHYLIKDDRLAVGRVTAQGFADSRPLTGNDSTDGRAQNRRVEIALDMPEVLAR